MQLNGPIVLAKKEATMKVCADATNHAATYGGKSWCYLLIPHDTIADNMMLAGLARQFSTNLYNR